jgi:hypothetical protein
VVATGLVPARVAREQGIPHSASRAYVIATPGYGTVLGH